MAGSRLGHLVILFDGAFYFIPEDKISPAIPLSRSDVKAATKMFKKMKAEHPEDFVDALRLADQEHLIRLLRRN